MLDLKKSELTDDEAMACCMSVFLGKQVTAEQMKGVTNSTEIQRRWFKTSHDEQMALCRAARAKLLLGPKGIVAGIRARWEPEAERFQGMTDSPAGYAAWVMLKFADDLEQAARGAGEGGAL
uniref:Uncharacterized protein n=1 Tax=viral metagenome TaxID=1070528 RepID=A0A6M3L9L6_9ZZZZ